MADKSEVTPATMRMAGKSIIHIWHVTAAILAIVYTWECIDHTNDVDILLQKHVTLGGFVKDISRAIDYGINSPNYQAECAIFNPTYYANYDAWNANMTGGIHYGAESILAGIQKHAYVNRNDILKDEDDRVLEHTAHCGDHGRCVGLGFGKWFTYEGFQQTGTVDASDSRGVEWGSGDQYQKQTCHCDAGYELVRRVNGDGIMTCDKKSMGTLTNYDNTTTVDDITNKKIEGWVAEFFDIVDWESEDVNDFRLSKLLNGASIPDLVVFLNVGLGETDTAKTLQNDYHIAQVFGNYQKLLSDIWKLKTTVNWLWTSLGAVIAASAWIILFNVMVECQTRVPAFAYWTSFWTDANATIYGTCVGLGFFALMTSFIVSFAYDFWTAVYIAVTKTGMDTAGPLADFDPEHHTELETFYYIAFLTGIATFISHIHIGMGALTNLGSRAMSELIREDFMANKSPPPYNASRAKSGSRVANNLESGEGNMEETINFGDLSGVTNQLLRKR